ncbi:MAG: heavy metal translocating P-type ATPase [Caldilineaceae bacterium]|nr:heavy metal translocating P-type ATPase [Caldilineaceae bacterium]
MSVEQIYHISGMDCTSCAQTVETGVRNLPGVESCSINFTSEKLRIHGNVSPAAVIERVEALGYGVTPLTGLEKPMEAAAPANFLHFLWGRTETRLALLGAILILPGLFLNELGGVEHAWIDLLSVAAMVSAGWPIARSALQSLRLSREININVLMSVAAVGAVIIGAYTEAGMVMVLFALGEALEGYTAGRARNAIRSLMEVVPNVATRLRRVEGRTVEDVVNIHDLAVGDLIAVRPGERIPMDGRVVGGRSSVNQAPITGESRLIEKEIGSDVLASSINGEGALEIEVTKPAEDNTISRLIAMVEEAQEKRAPTQRFVDRFARVYTPAVMVLAILVAAIPPIFFGQPFLNPGGETFGWLYRGLALLVVACPCALVISTPVTIISAISNAARHGVLFKGGVFVEALGRVNAIAFDKTGTLTIGSPAVLSIRSVACTQSPISNIQYPVSTSCEPCIDLLALAHAVERRSEHPLARAIGDASLRQGVADRYAPAENVTALTGRGVVGQIEGRQITVGSHAYFEKLITHPPLECERAAAEAALGYTPLMVGGDDRYLGTITVADRVRESSQAAVDALRRSGLKAVVMLTGDSKSTAAAIAEQVGVTDVRAELLPDQKVAAVEELQRVHGSIAMVGDGINDAPALATADVGIAIGGALGGTNQAMETADVTLMSDDLRRLPFALNLSRAARATIWINVILSIGVKAIFFVLVLMGIGTMWMAVLADMGTSLLVTLNGMRLLRYDKTGDRD